MTYEDPKDLSGGIVSIVIKNFVIKIFNIVKNPKINGY